MTAAAPPVPMPKRSRRRWYIVGGFTLALLATPFIYLLMANAWRDYELKQIYREIDAEDPHWRWADLIKQLPPAPPDEHNAMVQVRKITDMMKAAPLGKGPFGFTMPASINARLTVAEEQRLRAALAALPPDVLHEARKLKDMPEGQLIIDPALSPLEVDFDFLAMFGVARVLQHEAMLLANGGKTDEAADACLAALAPARAFGDFPSLHAQLIREANQGVAIAAIERTLAQGQLEEQRLVTLQDALTIEANHNGVQHALRGSRALGHHFYLALRDGTISTEKVITDMGLHDRAEGKLYMLFPSMLQRGYPDILRLQNEMVRAGDVKIEALAKLLQKRLDNNNPLLVLCADHCVRLSQERELRYARLRCAITALAAERHRLRFHHWPAGAGDLLKEGLLKEAFQDPYDGQPLRCRRTDAGFVVYAAGEDKLDNLGNLHRDGNPPAGNDVGFEPSFRATAAPAEEEVPKK